MSPPARKSPAPLQLDAAYSVCRSISRAAARNFYYSFLILPREKRSAMSAVYAFMRQCDDITDDATVPVRERRDRLAQYLQSVHRVLDGHGTDDPVLMALADTQKRFNIPVDWLDKLVQGTAMDLDERIPPRQIPPPLAPQAPVVLYRDFNELNAYCYHVASVVGLVCIRIFGYHDQRAEALAEKVGLAFQLTNIIRDVKEDAAMGRVYLPQSDLEAYGRSPSELIEAPDPSAWRAILELQAGRAREAYAAVDSLIPLIDEDSRSALWVLVSIYRQLLEKIAAANYNVFDGKIRLTTWQKVKVLARGWCRQLS
jgi:phytoene synthase